LDSEEHAWTEKQLLRVLAGKARDIFRLSCGKKHLRWANHFRAAADQSAEGAAVAGRV
jgi:hypothetical protein